MLQGMRAATRDDLPGIAELLAPLEQKGILKPRTREQLKAELPHYTVIDLEARVSAEGCPPQCPPPRPVAVLSGPLRQACVDGFVRHISACLVAQEHTFVLACCRGSCWAARCWRRWTQRPTAPAAPRSLRSVWRPSSGAPAAATPCSNTWVRLLADILEKGLHHHLPEWQHPARPCGARVTALRSGRTLCRASSDLVIADDMCALLGRRARGGGGGHPAPAAADDPDGGLVRAARVRAGRRRPPQRPPAHLEAHQGLLKRQRLSALLMLLFDRCLDVSVWFCDCSSCLVAAAFVDPLPSKWHANVVMCDMQVDPARNSKLFIKQLATEPLPMPEV
jgi:hypothetical protein